MKISLLSKREPPKKPSGRPSGASPDKLYVINGRGLHMYDVVGEPRYEGKMVGLRIRYSDIVWVRDSDPELQEFLRDRDRQRYRR